MTLGGTFCQPCQEALVQCSSSKPRCPAWPPDLRVAAPCAAPALQALTEQGGLSSLRLLCLLHHLSEDCSKRGTLPSLAARCAIGCTLCCV